MPIKASMGMISLPLLDVFGDAEMNSIFSSGSAISAWLEVEQALAEAQGALGVIPVPAAEKIAAELRGDEITWSMIREGSRTVGYPILPLLQILAERSSPEVGAYLHWGATTQDIMDTGLILQVRRGLDRLDELELRIGGALASLAAKHRQTVMAGRTHAQQAVPTTFGAKVAVWLEEFRRHRDRLGELRARVLVVQLFGAGGTAAALGPHSPMIRAEFARRLSLGTLTVPWHTSRDNLAEVGFVLASTAATAGKIAREVVELSRSEIAEVREVAGHLRGASSTMPQKANPVLSESIVGMSALAGQQVPALLLAMQGGHERSAGEWQIEWDSLPSVFALAGGALHNLAQVIEGLQVFPERMRANLSVDGGLIMSERVMMALAPIVGRADAHDLVYRLCTLAREDGTDFRSAICVHLEPDLLRQLPPLDDLLAPENYLGEAERIVDMAIDAWRQATAPMAGRLRTTS